MHSNGLVVAIVVLASGCASRQHSGKIERVPAPRIEHRVTPMRIAQQVAEARAGCEWRLKRLLAIPAAQRTFENTVEARDLAITALKDTKGRLTVLSSLHPNEETRRAAEAAATTLGTYSAEMESRQDVFEAVQLWRQGNGQAEVLDSEQRSLLDDLERDFRRNGLFLSDTDRTRLVEIRARVAALASDFKRNLSENHDTLELTAKELDGLPASFMDRLPVSVAGGRLVPVRAAEAGSILWDAVSPETRRRMYLALNSRDGERNTALLEEALLLRAKEATLLGFKSYAAFAATNTMAGDSETVSGFLSSLIEGIRAHRDEELARLAAAKVADTHDSRDLAPWDLAYYQHTIAKASAPEEVPDVSAFFPATRVVPGILRMCEKLLDLEIRLVADADGWAPGIELYEVRDRSNGDLMGSFYLDLYARPGKFTQSAVSTAGVARQEGHSYLTPVAVLHTNFPPPTSDRPALLGMGDLRRLFHEFGHLMHIVLTTVRYGGQSGAATLSDFREVPSLLFEHFATDQQVLVAISGHVLDPARKLPGDFIARLQKQRSESTGVSLAHKVYVAALDQALHSGSDLGVDATDRRVYAEIVGLAAADQAHFSATVPHLMLKGGVYFSYLWSEVIADDLFTRFAEAGGADPGVGRQYRDLVLARGASVAPDQLLRDFLGRKSNPDAFLRKLGLH